MRVHSPIAQMRVLGDRQRLHEIYDQWLDFCAQLDVERHLSVRLDAAPFIEPVLRQRIQPAVSDDDTRACESSA